MNNEPEHRSTDTQASTRHTFSFTREQVIRILASQIQMIPNGERFLWGLESEPRRDEALTLVIDEQPKPEPPKPREFWIYHWKSLSGQLTYAEPQLNMTADEVIHVREVL